jgi:hypothetical protein
MNRKRIVDLYLPRHPVGGLRFVEPCETETFRDMRFSVERRDGCTVFWLGERVRFRAVPLDPGKGT